MLPVNSDVRQTVQYAWDSCTMNSHNQETSNVACQGTSHAASVRVWVLEVGKYLIFLI